MCKFIDTLYFAKISKLLLTLQYQKYKNLKRMTTKQQELENMLKQQQKNQLSSQEEESRDQVTSKSQFRKPIKNPFSDHSDQSDSDLQNQNQATTGTPFPPKPPTTNKTALQHAQSQMKWDKNQQLQTEILTKLQGQGMKDKKIKQLASKYKALNIAYEKEKTLRKNFEAQLNSMLKTTDQLNKSIVQKKEKKSLQKTTISSCSNCQQNEKKIMDFRLKNQNLKSQLNKATRVISRQLGEDFNIDQVLGQQNGWKGRQQKIQKLKARVKQLQQKLNNNGINVSHMSGFTQVTTANKTNAGFSSTRTSALMAENKKKQFDNLKIQVDALKSQNQILQGKVKSLVSRKIILQNEIKQVKTQFESKRQLLIQKSENDDKFIQLLKNENQRLKKQQKVVTKVIYKDDGGEVTQLKKQIQSLRKKLKATETSTKNILNQDQSQKINEQKMQKKMSKDLNSLSSNRVVSAEKKKKLQQEYLKNDKYLSKMSAQDEQQLYKNWKNNLKQN